jgi:hypothetical protein
VDYDADGIDDVITGSIYEDIYLFRGLGEGGTIGAPAAIANALSDALSPLGIEIDELPATPRRLFRLIESARARGRAEES